MVEREGGKTWSLRVSGLTKHYGRRAALEDVAFSIHGAEVLGLIGPNGAGKTTLFECLAGVLPPTAGVLLQDDRVVDARTRKTLLFYLPDAIAPWPVQSVRWALDFTIGFFGGRTDLREEVIGTLALEYTLGSPPGPGRNGASPHPDLYPAANPVLQPPVKGRIGLWSKTDSTSEFKDYAVTSK